MKLFELLGVKAHADRDLLDILSDFKLSNKRGSKFNLAGEGAAAQVLLHDSGTIYKFWAKDSAYEKFIDYVSKHQDNKHLPKFKSKIKELTAFFKRPADFPEKIKYVKMERLQPIGIHTKFPGTKNLYVIDAIRDINNAIDNGDSFDSLVEWLIHTAARDDEPAEFDPHVVKVLKELWDTIEDLYKAKLGRMDLHSGNVMLRGGEIVITDPVIDVGEINFNQELMQQIEKLNAETRVSKFDKQIERMKRRQRGEPSGTWDKL